MKASTKKIHLLPNPKELKKICKSISVLEAIISPDWEFRYYSYQKDWSETEEFCEMRNGEGDHMLILFTEKGTCINGFSHESEVNTVNELPKQFEEFIFGEPVKSIGTTFCIWSEDNQTWNVVECLNNEYKDGSEKLLELLDGNPETYKKWAEYYYGESFEEEGIKLNLNVEVLQKIYNGGAITKELVEKINPLIDVEELKSNLNEIGCLYQL